MAETGTFLSRDPVESEPAYQYVREKPINLTDPSGACPAGTCGGDITEWLMEEMKSHYNYGLEVKEQLNDLWWEKFFHDNTKYLFEKPLRLKGLYATTPFDDIIDSNLLGIGDLNDLSAIDMLGVLEYALYGLAVDYSNVDYGADISSCGSSNCLHIIPKHTSVTLCGKCVDSSDIGNMMFGLGGSARGYSAAFAYGSAATYNGLADDWEGVSGLLKASFGSPDGRGAIPGYQIGSFGAYQNRWLFCQIINADRFIGYNQAREVHEQCKACDKKASPITMRASSLFRVSGIPGSTIDELKGKLHKFGIVQ